MADHPTREPRGVPGEALSADHVHEVLDACLLTDTEFAAGPAAWARFDDPFVEWQDDVSRESGAA